MGLIKSALGSAMGANNVNNGFGGPRLPFGNKPTARASTTQYYPDDTSDYDRYAYQDDSRGRRLPHHRARPRSVGQSMVMGSDPYMLGGDLRNNGSSYNASRRSWQDGRRHEDQYYDIDGYDNDYDSDRNASSRRFDRYDDNYRLNAGQPPEYSRYDPGVDNYPPPRPRSSNRGGFRPLALPQITYGDGQPFLRGYSDELGRFGISEGESRSWTK